MGGDSLAWHAESVLGVQFWRWHIGVAGRKLEHQNINSNNILYVDVCQLVSGHRTSTATYHMITDIVREVGIGRS